MSERYLSVKKVELPDGRIVTIADDEVFIPWDPPKSKKIKHMAGSDDLGFINRSDILTTEDIEKDFFK